MHNNTNSIVYFHTQNTNHYDSMCNICTNIGLNLFDCQKIDDLSYIINNFTPMYLVVDIENSFDKHIMQELISHNIKPIMFIIDNFDMEIRNNNIFKVNNFDCHFIYSFCKNFTKLYLNSLVCVGLIWCCNQVLIAKIKLISFVFIGIARALLQASPDYRPVLKKAGMLTRDARAKERKKYGLKASRRAPQFSKR